MSQYLTHARNIRAAYDEKESILDAARYIIFNCVPKEKLEALKTRHKDGIIKLRKVDAEYAVWAFTQQLLNKDEYEAAAIIQWGPEQFSPEPHHTKLVWSALKEDNLNLLMGGGSLGKSFNGGVYFGLDFMRDPEFTTIKVISSTAGHAATNIFAHMKNLLTSCLSKIPNLRATATSIQVGDNNKYGVHLQSIPTGDDGKGRLRGFHPAPRPTSHPIFGPLSRIRVLLDEAEAIPGGVWEELNNILLTEDTASSNVKVFAATNPKDRTSRFGQECEPASGWASLDIERDETWRSARGWRVTRLDGAKCENVISKTIVYPGFQTWEGFERLLKLGLNNAEYFTMARGWFPEASAQSVIITESLFAQAKGTYLFSGPTIAVAGIDLAFEGEDAVEYTLSRHGLAIGWTDPRGKYHKFTNEQRVIQIEQQFTIAKADTLAQAKALMRLSKELSVNPAWVGADRTGNGTGVVDVLRSLYGDAVLGIHWSEAATDLLIMQDDTEPCSDIYTDIVTEMAFALRRFMEADLIKFNPGINWNALERQCVSRRYSMVGRNMRRIEPKKEYKKRNQGKSPDKFDSLIMNVHVVRVNEGMSVTLVKNPARNRLPRPKAEVHGIVDVLDFVDMSD